MQAPIHTSEAGRPTQDGGRLEPDQPASEPAAPVADAGVAVAPAQSRKGSRRLRLSLRFYLAGLVLAALLPTLVLTTVAVMQTGRSYREAAAKDLRTIARIVSIAVQREVVATVDMLSELALLHALGQGPDLAHDIEALGVPLGASRISLVSAQSASATTEIANMDPVARKTLTDVVAHVSWQVSNLGAAAAGGAAHIAVAVPYRSSDGDLGTLLFEARPDRIIRSFTQDQMAAPELAERMVAVIDGNGRVLVHSRDPGRVGEVVPERYLQLARDAEQGVYEGARAGEQPAIVGFSRVAQTPGWMVVVGELKSLHDARWAHPRRWLFAGAMVALLLTLGLAAAVARLVLSPVRALVQRTHRIADGSRAAAVWTPGRWSIIELDALRDAVEAAGSVMSERVETVRRRAEQALQDKRRYRILAQASALVIWRRSPDGLMTAIVGWQELTGQKPEYAGVNWLESIHVDDRVPLNKAWQDSKVAQSAIDVEIRVRTREGCWRWMRARGAPVRDDAGHLLEWIGVLEDVDARRREQERIAYLAMHDGLTGLPNRTVFHEQLVRAIDLAGRGDAGLLLYVDLDEFKQVNDSHGHAVGDALLIAIAGRLRALVRRTDTVARLGGDEFAIVQASQPGENVQNDLPARVAAAMSKPFMIEALTIQTSASIGVVRIRNGLQDPERLLRQADIALYSAKSEGDGRFVWFDEIVEPPNGIAP